VSKNRAVISQEGQLTEPQDPILGASIDIGSIDDLIGGLIHPVNHSSDGVFVAGAADGSLLDEEEFGLAQQIGSTGQDLKVKPFGPRSSPFPEEERLPPRRSH
jgi:hypothetical protein